jgi:hypothetical protein
MYEPITDIDPRWCIIHRWIWLAMPDDAAQEVRLTFIEFPNLTEAARADLISDRLRSLAHQCWRREIIRRPPMNTKPSKLKRATGYRKDPDRKRDARMRLSPERRAEIAREGYHARIAT